MTMKKRTQRMCRVEDPDWPDHQIGIVDLVELMGTSIETVRRVLQRGEKLFGVTVVNIGEVQITQDRTCVRCGEVIGNLRCTVYCDACRAENRAKGQARRVARGEAREKGDQKVRHRVPYDQMSPLARVEWDARKAGMTYGQYMTKITAQWFPKTGRTK